MNWIVFAITVWLLTGMDVGLAPAFQLGTLPIVPSFLFVLLGFIGLWARWMTLATAALIIGAIMDLYHQVPTTDGADVVVLGPFALGCLLGAQAIHGSRGLMFRQSTVTLALLVFMGASIAHATAYGLLSIRALYDNLVMHSVATEIGTRIGSALYTALLALPAGWLLQRLSPMFSFRSAHGLSAGARR